MKNTPIWLKVGRNLVFCAANLNLKSEMKKKKLWSYSSSNLKHITKKFNLTSGLNRNSSNDHWGLFIGLEQPQAKVKQEFNVEKP